MPWNQYSGSIAFKPPNKKAFLESQVKNVKQTVMVLMILVNTVVVLQNGMTTSPSESFGYLSDFLCHLPSESVFTVTHLLQLCCCILFWHLTVHLQRITESVLRKPFRALMLSSLYLPTSSDAIWSFSFYMAFQ